MHQWQHWEIANQRVEARRSEADSRRQRKAARYVRVRRRFGFFARRHPVADGGSDVTTDHGMTELGLVAGDPIGLPMHHDTQPLDRRAA